MLRQIAAIMLPLGACCPGGDWNGVFAFAFVMALRSLWSDHHFEPYAVLTVHHCQLVATVGGSASYL